ncbi:hypothetical protein [Limnobaculum sp. M2-1]|nr:hypothetical protein [Limnobaculum sp. M2-1]
MKHLPVFHPDGPAQALFKQALPVCPAAKAATTPTESSPDD